MARKPVPPRPSAPKKGATKSSTSSPKPPSIKKGTKSTGSVAGTYKKGMKAQYDAMTTGPKVAYQAGKAVGGVIGKTMFPSGKKKVDWQLFPKPKKKGDWPKSNAAYQAGRRSMAVDAGGNSGMGRTAPRKPKAAPSQRKPYKPNWNVPAGTPWREDSPFNPKNKPKAAPKTPKTPKRAPSNKPRPYGTPATTVAPKLNELKKRSKRMGK